jgi:hypothetical protein
MEPPTRAAGVSPVRTQLAAGAFALYCALTAAVFWPCVRDPAGTLIRNDDVYGNAWAMAWVVHQATRSPLDLFDANSFYPRSSSFAYTEPLLPIALQGAPLLLLGGSPILAHNVVLLLSFPLAGLGMFLLARDRTGSSAAGLFAGLAYAFSAYRFQHLVPCCSCCARSTRAGGAPRRWPPCSPCCRSSAAGITP